MSGTPDTALPETVAPAAAQVDPTTVQQETVPVTPLDALQTRIKNALEPAALNEPTITNVVNALTEKEIARRTGILAEGLTKFQAAQVEFRKASQQKPSFNADGTKGLVPMTETEFKAMNQAKEKLTKLTATLNKAISVGDKDSYKKLEDQNKGVKGDGEE